MKFKQTITATVFALALSAVPVLAQPGVPGGGRHMHHGMMMGYFHGRMAEALQLTDAQKEFAKQLRAETKTQADPVTTELRQIRQQLADAIKTNNTGAIQNLATRQGNLSGQLAAIHANSMAKFYAQLTPEQQAKAEELRSQWQERGKNFRERMQNRHGNEAPQAQ